MDPRWWEKYQVSVPEGESGDMKIERFTIEEEDPQRLIYNMRLALIPGGSGREVPAGTFTRLEDAKKREIVMSDTPAEIRDHLSVIREIEKHSTKRVLIHGLGIGMVLQAALRQPWVKHVDVVEISSDVVALAGPHYDRMARKEGKTLNIWLDDALEKRWPRGSRWDVAWHDIWNYISSDNLESMAVLNRRYGQMAGWQGAWAQDLCRMQRSQYA